MGRDTRVGRGFVPVRVACRAEARRRCLGTLRLRSASAERLTKRGRSAIRTLGSRRFSLRSGRSATLRVPIGTTGRALLRRGAVRVRSIATVRDAGSARGTTRQLFLLRPST